jgi:hypothetical protein
MQITYRPITIWPRDFTRGRRRSPFKAAYHSTFTLLERELRHANARAPVIQLALDPSQFRVSDGKPYANATPTHPGVILSFEKGKERLPLAFPCDTYLTWIENLRAIALALDALRRVDRYGVTQRAEQYRGWNALPPANPIVTPHRMTVEAAAAFVANEGGPVPWGDVLRNADTFRAAKRRASMKLHPDQNGGVDRPEWHMLQEATAVLEKHLGL